MIPAAYHIMSCCYIDLNRRTWTFVALCVERCCYRWQTTTATFQDVKNVTTESRIQRTDPDDTLLHLLLLSVIVIFEKWSSTNGSYFQTNRLCHPTDDKESKEAAVVEKWEFVFIQANVGRPMMIRRKMAVYTKNMLFFSVSLVYDSTFLSLNTGGSSYNNKSLDNHHPALTAQRSYMEVRHETC